MGVLILVTVQRREVQKAIANLRRYSMVAYFADDYEMQRQIFNPKVLSCSERLLLHLIT